MDKLYLRWQEHTLKKALHSRRILLLAGARQCGKTTLTKTLGLEKTTYITLDNHAALEAAKRDPGGFVQHGEGTLIIDEIQRVPELLLAIKKAVDENTAPGQYLLTGSSNIQASPTVKESLAGRVRKIRLRTFSQGEISGTVPHFFDTIFEQKFGVKKMACSQADVVHRAIRGGYPEAIGLDAIERKLWHKDYIASLLERDLKDIANIKRSDAMQSMISVMAAWSSKFMDISSIGSVLSISRQTIESYINALESLFLIERVKPWIKTDYERVGRRNKVFMTDCGLMASILGWKEDALRFDGDQLGKLIETFVFNELMAQIEAHPGVYEIYQYRDKDKKEIDFIVEREDGKLLGIEVKAGSVVTAKSFKQLQWFSEKIAHNHYMGIILYTGEHILSFGENMYAIPMGCLWH